MAIHPSIIVGPMQDDLGFSTTVYLNLRRLGVEGGGEGSSRYWGFLRGVEGVYSGFSSWSENLFCEGECILLLILIE